jgi:hypothetical protein
MLEPRPGVVNRIVGETGRLQYQYGCYCPANNAKNTASADSILRPQLLDLFPANI